VGAVVLDMGRVDQRDEGIDIDQKPFQRNSSRNFCTISDVTRLAPARTGNSGIPFRVWRRDSSGLNPRRASDEMTSPTVLFCAVAISLAAPRTSSSIDRVVRISSASHIKHHTSDACTLEEAKKWPEN
jgi:hypothetical protein